MSLRLLRVFPSMVPLQHALARIGSPAHLRHSAMSLDDMMKVLMKPYRLVLDGIDSPACHIFHRSVKSNVKKKAAAFDSRASTFLNRRFPMSWNARHVMYFTLRGLGGRTADMQHASPPRVALLFRPIRWSSGCSQLVLIAWTDHLVSVHYA